MPVTQEESLKLMALVHGSSLVGSSGSEAGYFQGIARVAALANCVQNESSRQVPVAASTTYADRSALPDDTGDAQAARAAVQRSL